MRKTALVATILLAVAASPVLAQSLTGSVTGVVRDEQGGALPGASVSLAGAKGTRSAVSDPQGGYRFMAVDPGRYTLTAALSGFQSQKHEDIDVSIGKVITRDFGLKVGGLTEELSVLAEAPVVDVTSTETTNALSQDLLFNMPLNRFAPDLLNYAPGINDGAAFGGGATAGGSPTSSALLIDGVDTRDPEGGTPWSFINYNVIEEVQIQGLGAPAEYGAFTGAIVNSVTRSGGNSFSGLFDVNYTKDSLSSDNRSAEVLAANPTLGTSVTTGFLDFTTQISGPIIRDKLFFFASAQRYHLEYDPFGPRTTGDELSHRGNLKVNYNPGPSDNLIFHLEFDDYNIIGRSGFDSNIDTDAQTVREDAPEFIWNVQWRHLFGSRTFLEAKYLGWWGYFYLDPEVVGPRFFDAGTSTYNDNPITGGPSSGGSFYYADRGRDELHASISHFAEAFGQHDLKFGVQIERSRVRSRYGYPAGVNYYDYSPYYPVGQYYAYSYGYDVSGRNQRESIYVQDSWKPNGRLTINAGLRFDNIRGRSPELDETVFDTQSFAPRVGFAFDLTGDRKTVLKAHYGHYYEAAFFTLYQRAVPGRDDYVGFCFDGVGDGTGPPGFSECARTPFSAIYAVDPDVKHPRMDEFTAGIERAITSDVRFSVTGIWRKSKNFVDGVYPDARFTRASITNELTGQPEEFYRWENSETSVFNGLITNIDDWEYLDPDGNVIARANPKREYKGLMLVLSKRFSNRWQGQVSYVLAKTEGTADNASFGVSTGVSNVWKTPNTAVVNAFGPTGADRTHEVKLFATYQVPKVELSLNAYYRYLTGVPYNARYRFNSSDRADLNMPLFPGAQREVLLEPRGSRRVEDQSLLDLRLEKIFKIGGRGDKISVYADIVNVFNSGTINFVQTRVEGISAGSPPVDLPYETPTSLVAPRQVTLGARWSF
jgi:hypothetical protein